MINFSKKTILVLVLSSLTTILIAQTFTPGSTYHDDTGYVRYQAGNLPIVISAPHGGSLEPASIPDRDCAGCSVIKDSWTQTIAEGLYDAIFEQTGCYPHLIINLLHRKKFDANRDIDDAADGDPTVEQAWYGYHELIDSAKAQVVQDYSRGLFLDIHGHAHTIQRIELGYLLSGSELRLSDTDLNTSAYIDESSILTLVGDNIQNLSHSDLLRGEDSFGTLLDEKGFPAVPSFSDPFPDVGEDYFSGGYNTVRHGSRDNNGEIDAIQIELNQDVRFNSTNRALLIDSLSKVANEYIDLHYNDQYEGNYCALILPVELSSFEAKQKDENILLEWQSRIEINNAFFEIERSRDGHNFKKIGQVNGSGNSTNSKQYSFLDDAPHIGINYYRLKQFDYDGRYQYSSIIKVDIDGRQNFAIYPNPSPAAEIKVAYHSPQVQKVSFLVFDVTGKLVLNQRETLLSGINHLQFDFSNFQKGVYFIQIKGEQLHAFEKLIIE